MTTRPLSLRQPPLTQGFAFAVVEPTGRVLFHSDHERALSENLSLATDEDPVLRALLLHEEPDLLTTTYWGEPIRAYVRPLPWMSWSIVTYQGLDDSRIWLFELAHDYLNLSLLFLGVYGSIASAVWMGARKRLRRALWPWAERQGTYAVIALATPLAAAVAAVALALKRPFLIFGVSFGMPVLFLLLILLFPRASLSYLQTFRGKLSGSSRRLAALTLPLALALGVGLLLGLGFAPVLTLAVALAVFWTVALCWRSLDFSGPNPRTPYLFAAAGVLTAAAVLPALGFYSLAHDRQTHLLVREAQISLARQLAANIRESRPAAPLMALAGHGSVAFFSSIQGEYLASFFHTVAADEVADLPVPGRRVGPRWPPERPSASGPEDDHFSRLLSAIMGARLLSFDRLWSSTVTDASTRSLTEHITWGRDADGHQLLRYSGDPGTEPGDRYSLGRRFTLSSSVPASPTLRALPVYHKVLLLIGILLVSASAPLLVRPTARHVLLWPLGAFVGGSDPKKPTAVALDDVLRSGEITRKIVVAPEVEPVDFRYLVSTDPLANDTSADGPERPPTFHEAHFEAAWQRAQEEPHRDGALPGDMAGSEEREDEEPQSLRRSEVFARELVSGAPSGQPILLLDFVPELDDERTALDQIDAIKYLTESEERSVVILTEELPAPLATTSAGPSGSRSRARDRWAELLGTFSVTYAKGTRGVALEPMVESLAEKVDHILNPEKTDRRGPDYSQAQALHLKNLVAIVFQECSPTLILQRIGVELLREIWSVLRVVASPRGVEEGEHDAETSQLHMAQQDRLPQHWLSVTTEQLILDIGAKARLHYQRLWKDLSPEERLILFQLAEEGVINPKSLPWIVDLRNRGLIVKDPALRVMNESFRRFVLLEGQRTGIAELEGQAGGGWNVLRWLLPIPLVALSLFLLMTRQGILYSITGLVVVLASLAPFLFNLFTRLQRITARLRGDISTE